MRRAITVTVDGKAEFAFQKGPLWFLPLLCEGAVELSNRVRQGQEVDSIHEAILAAPTSEQPQACQAPLTL